MYRTVNPFTGECVAAYPLHDDAQVEAALARSASAFAHWRGLAGGTNWRTRLDRRAARP